MLICILTKNVITSCSVTMMLFLHLEVKPLMTLTTVLYLSCALISGHLAMMLMRSEERRVGKECRSGGKQEHLKKRQNCEEDEKDCAENKGQEQMVEQRVDGVGC